MRLCSGSLYRRIEPFAEAADRVASIKDRRFTVTHGNIPNAAAIARAKKLGVLSTFNRSGSTWTDPPSKTFSGPTVLNPEQRISRMEALKMWTWNGAYLIFAEKDRGSIEPGKLADLVVLSKEYEACPEDEIKDIEALRTVVGGKPVYDKLR